MCGCNSSGTRVNTIASTTSTRTTPQPRYADDGTVWELVSQPDADGNRTVVTVHGKAAAFGQFYAPGARWAGIDQVAVAA